MLRRHAIPLALLVATAAALVWVPWSQPAAPGVLREDAPPLVAPAIDDAPRSIAELRARVLRVLEREGVPGCGIALVGRDGPIWIGGVGVADLTTGVPVDANTVFRAASITKSFVGLGVMRLVEQGRLDLDRPLRDVVPDAGIANPWEDTAPVTLAHVLEHTAGLDDMHFNEFYTDDDALTASAALAINPRSREIRWRPGTRMSYANPGYTLAARAIEVATGEPFDAWLRRDVLVPLGMRDADFRRTDALAPRLATGYIDRGRAAPFAPIAHRPAGALLTSATDLAKLVEFWLRRDGALVSPAGLARIERTATLPYPRMDVDYGLGNYGDVSQPVRSRGHDGGLPGFASSLRYFPELGRGYVILLNATHSFAAWLEIRRLVFAYLTRDLALPQPAVGAPGDLGASFYAFANPRHELFGFVERALLGWHPEPLEGGARLDPLVGAPIHLVATADGGYRLFGQSGTSIRFARDRDGAPVMIAGFVYAEPAAWWPARLRVQLLRLALLLLQLAPLWGGVVLAYGLLRRGRVVALDLALWPAIAGACVYAFPRVGLEAATRGLLGVVHPLTIAICAITIVFATASIASVASAIRWSLRPDRPSLAIRLVPWLTAIAAAALTVWLGVNGIIGLRTWAW